MLRGAAALTALLAVLHPAAVFTDSAAVLTSVSAAWACPGEQALPSVPRGDLTYWSAFQQRLAAEVRQADEGKVRQNLLRTSAGVADGCWLAVTHGGSAGNCRALTSLSTATPSLSTG